MLPTVGLDHGPELLLPPAEAAERLGCDSVWGPTTAMSHARESENPYQRSGTEIAMNPGIGWLEPLAVLLFRAARTERVRLGTSAPVLPYRNPIIVAEQAATLHLLSGARLVLGVGRRVDAGGVRGARHRPGAARRADPRGPPGHARAVARRPGLVRGSVLRLPRRRPRRAAARVGAAAVVGGNTRPARAARCATATGGRVRGLSAGYAGDCDRLPARRRGRP